MPARRKKKVALDLDSTLYDLERAMRAQSGGARVWLRDCVTWDTMPTLCEGGYEGMLRLFDQAFQYQTMRDIGLLPGASEALQALAQAEVEIHVMTKRPEQIGPGTERWLRELGIPLASFHCQEPFDKIALCKSLGIDVIVDDHPVTLRQAHEAGMTALSLRYPYNHEVIDQLGLDAADSWEDLLPLLLRVLEIAPLSR